MATINGTFVTKSIDTSTSFLYDRKEVVTGPMWSNGKSSLTNIYTSSKQPHHQKIYYKNVFANNQSTQSVDVEFSISYGNFYGSGSSTGSYGLISGSGSGWNKLSVTESMAVYSQYRNLLLDYDKREYLSNGKFRFFGNTDTDIGLYVFGNFRNNQYTGIYYTPHKMKLPDVKYGSPLNKIKSISYAKYQNKTNLSNEHRWFAINTVGKLYQNADSGFSPPDLADEGPWKDVSLSWADSNLYHILLVKEDGTLWVAGNNADGQLGLGYKSATPINELIKVGFFNDWEKVYAGSSFSLGLRNGGKLYAWGKNSSQQLGLGDQIDRTSPTLVGDNIWKKIVVGNLDLDDIVNQGRYETIMGIDVEGKLWAWGDDTSDKFTPSSDGTPVLLNSDTNWKDVSIGRDFVITIKGDDNELYAWGYGGTNGRYFGNSLYSSTYTFNQRELISTDTGWKSISSGVDFTIAIGKLDDIYGWGDNDVNQLSIDTSPDDYANTHRLLSTDLIGWDSLSCGAYHSIATINIPNKNATNVISDDIYAINIKRCNFKDKIDAGTWQFSLYTVNEDLTLGGSYPTINTNDIITLVDETTTFTDTTNQNPMYDIFSKGGAVYNIYQGTIDGGIDRSSKDFPYGLFFPENGIIILNAESLYQTNNNWYGIQTRRTPATASGAFPFSSNAEMIYTAMSASMNLIIH